MIGHRLATLVYGLRHLRRAPDLEALRAAASPAELARLAIIPAARNLGMSAGFLRSDLRAEFTAALLACRVLDAYEDLSEQPKAAAAVMAAADYLNGVTDVVPPPPPGVAVRASEEVDLALAERIDDVRTLLSALPPAGQHRAVEMLGDVARVMAQNVESPLPRAVYGRGVLGRVVHYVCSLITESCCEELDSMELAECLGVLAQLANDLRDREYERYGVTDREELKRAVMVRLLGPSVGGFALLQRLGERIPTAGARMGMAYMTITTPAFLCTTVGVRAAYPRRLRFAAAVLAAQSPRRWSAMVDRVRRSTDAAIDKVLDSSPALLSDPGLVARSESTGPSALSPLIVDTMFDFVNSLPTGRLTGELPVVDVRRMMFADHLAFGAIEWLRPRDAAGLAALAAQFQRPAIDEAGVRS